MDETMLVFFKLISQSEISAFIIDTVDTLITASSDESNIVNSFPYLATKISRGLHNAQDFVQGLLENELSRLTDPQVMFRTDNCSTRVLRQFVHDIMDAPLSKALAPIIGPLFLQRLSIHQVCRKTTEVLKVIFTFDYPTEFRGFCKMIHTSIARKFPGSERYGLCSIFFLRYLCPRILASPQSFGAVQNEFYLENCVRIVKLIQLLANDASPCRSTLQACEMKIFSSKNQKKMAELFAQMSVVYPHLAEMGTPGTEWFSEHSLIPAITHPSTEEMSTFAQVILACGPMVLNRLQKAIRHETLDPQSQKTWLDMLAQCSSISGPSLERVDACKPMIQKPHTRTKSSKSSWFKPRQHSKIRQNVILAEVEEDEVGSTPSRFILQKSISSIFQHRKPEFQSQRIRYSVSHPVDLQG